MGLKSFFFPKNFKSEMMKGKFSSDYALTKGIEKVSEHKYGKFFLKFFSWMPIVGHFFFWREGKKKIKEEELQDDQKKYVKKTKKKMRKGKKRWVESY